MTDQFRRLRALVGEQFSLVVVVLVVLAAVGGWMTFGAYGAPGTHTKERTVSTWKTAGDFSHHATVVNGTEVFAEGATVQNRSVYFTKVMPVLSGEYVFAYSASGSGSLDVAVDADLVIESVGETGDGETKITYWRLTEDLASTEKAGVAPGGRVTVPFEVNVSALTARIERIQEQLGGEGEIQTRVQVDIVLAGTVNGHEVDRQLNYTLGIAPQGGTYRVTGDGATTQQYATTRTVTVPNEPGAVGRFGGPALLGLSLIALVGLVGARQHGHLMLTEDEREQMAFEDDRSDFEEWITTIHLPDEALDDGPEAEAATLGDLVDFAIDADEGVVEDPERDAYFVFHDGRRFAYYPPEGVNADESGIGAEPTGEAPVDESLGETEESGEGTTVVPDGAEEQESEADNVDKVDQS